MARSKAIAKRIVPDGAAKPAPIKKKRRYRPGTIAKREVRRYQHSVAPLIPRLPVRRLVQSMLTDCSSSGQPMRMTRTAFEQLYAISSTIMSEALGAAERVRASEKKGKSIMPRHVRVGRTMLGIKCLSDSQLPIERPTQVLSKKVHATAAAAPKLPPS